MTRTGSCHRTKEKKIVSIRQHTGDWPRATSVTSTKVLEVTSTKVLALLVQQYSKRRLPGRERQGAASTKVLEVTSTNCSTSTTVLKEARAWPRATSAAATGSVS